MYAGSGQVVTGEREHADQKVSRSNAIEGTQKRGREAGKCTGKAQEPSGDKRGRRASDAAPCRMPTSITRSRTHCCSTRHLPCPSQHRRGDSSSVPSRTRHRHRGGGGGDVKTKSGGRLHRGRASRRASRLQTFRRRLRSGAPNTRGTTARRLVVPSLGPVRWDPFVRVHAAGRRLQLNPVPQEASAKRRTCSDVTYLAPPCGPCRIA